MEANPSNDVEDRKIGARKGGIAICFHPGMQPLLHDRGSMAGNSVLNIYASNMASERCATWNEIFQTLQVGSGERLPM